jgi:hypothetical protein
MIRIVKHKPRGSKNTALGSPEFFEGTVPGSRKQSRAFATEAASEVPTFSTILTESTVGMATGIAAMWGCRAFKEFFRENDDRLRNIFESVNR